ncbi:MAG: hypothetical protein CMO44_17280 [Verrucomicrobiales bacterium]|nr:hypothetical protein [Verrucomicrobiales bacterium]
MESKPKEYRSIISASKIKSLRSLYFNNTFVFICRNLIHSKIFENGLCLRSSQAKNCKNNPLTDQLMNNHWLPFARDIIDSIVCIGLVAIRYKEVSGDMIPYVPQAGTYEIHVVTDAEGKARYEFFSNDKPINIENPTENAFVLNGFGYDPERNGRLNSTIQALYPTIEFMSALHDYALQAEKIRSNPPIIMQKKAENNTQAQEGLHFDHFVDGDSVKVSIHNQYTRDSADIKQLQNQQQLFLNAIRGAEDGESNNSETALKNMVPLPNQYSVGTTLEPSSRTDFVSILRLNQETICALIGVPRSMIINDSVTRADIQGSHDVFRQTLIFWKKTISNTLSKVYYMIYEQYERERIASSSKRRKVSNLNDFVKSSLVRIEIPTVPYVSNNELRSLYLHGVISWKYYGEYMLRNASLPVDILQTKDPWSQDDRKEFLGVSVKPPDSETAKKVVNPSRTE